MSRTSCLVWPFFKGLLKIGPHKGVDNHKLYGADHSPFKLLRRLPGTFHLQRTKTTARNSLWPHLLQGVRALYLLHGHSTRVISGYSCLHTVNPRNCPLCRKAFIPERSKKIITGELPPPEDANEVNLLRRLATSWDLEEEQLVGVTTEVEEWLRGREETPVSHVNSWWPALLRDMRITLDRPSFPCRKHFMRFEPTTNSEHRRMMTEEPYVTSSERSAQRLMRKIPQMPSDRV